MKRFLKIALWISGSIALVLVLLLSPVAYVETFCRASSEPSSFKPLITKSEWQRAEANTYLTYPEWHIVYAYEGLAKVIKTGDEYQFPYVQSIGSFWSSFCTLNQEANRHGDAEFAHRATIHIIGVSFTIEMGMKALYEETVGRIAAFIRGNEKTPQDQVVAAKAEEFGAFLHQVPWYKFDFETANRDLWSAPVTGFRSWERRLAMGGEWKAKAAYAKAIGSLVAATGEAKLDIYSVVNGLTITDLSAMKDVKIIQELPEGILINTPRYTIFSNLIVDIISKGGKVVEVAGNDEIMLSATAPAGSSRTELKNGRFLLGLPRDGFDDERVLINAKVADLNLLLPELVSHNILLEQLYDY